MTIIDAALAQHGLCREVVFAAEPGQPFPRSHHNEQNAITFILGGRQNTYFYRDGRPCHEIIESGRVYFRVSGCYDEIDWRHPCRRLGVALRDNWLGMAWKATRKPEPLEVRTDLWFSPSDLEPHAEIVHLFQALAARRRLPGDSPLTRQLPVMILEKMLEILAAPEREIAHSAIDTYRRICRYLEGNFHLPVSRKTVADIFHLHPDYLTRLFNEFSNMGFSDYLTGLRLRRAREMLQNTVLPVKEVARQCGFAEPGYFIKVFRRTCGGSPGEWKKLSRQDV